MGHYALVAASSTLAEAAENSRAVSTVVRRCRPLLLVFVMVLPLACARSGSTRRCPFGVCATSAVADAGVVSPSAALVAEIETSTDPPVFAKFGLLFRDKLAANSIVVAEGVAACDDAAVVSGVVLDRRDGGGGNVAIDTAIACWATATSPRPSAEMLVTVTLPMGDEELLLLVNAAFAGDDLDVFPEVAATWAVGSAWQYSTNAARLGVSE